MTCDRCKNIPDEIIDTYVKEKIADLKEQLAELENKPKVPTAVVPRKRDECKGSGYPNCCWDHGEAYYNTAG